MTDLPLQIPTGVYVAAGAIVIANIGTILTILVFIFKGGMFVAETRAGIKDAKSTAVRAHKRIDILETGTATTGYENGSDD